MFVLVVLRDGGSAADAFADLPPARPKMADAGKRRVEVLLADRLELAAGHLSGQSSANRLDADAFQDALSNAFADLAVPVRVAGDARSVLPQDRAQQSSMEAPTRFGE